jgi:hypothetical protein
MSVLTADPEANRADLVRLGQRFSIVTPGTSLLVLETRDQYLEHDVTPPETSPELRAAFLDRRAQEGNLRTVKRTDKIARVVAMWERRVEHWSREFPDQVLPPVNAPAADQARDLPDAAVGGVGGRVANALPMPSAPVPATMPPPSVAAGAAPAEAPAAMRQSMRMAADSQSAHSSAGPAAGIVIQSWNPDTPYLRSLGAAPAGDAYGRYLAERGTYGRSPAFYLDCAGFFFERGERPLALRVLTSVAELKIDDARLMRVLAHRLEQAGELDLAIDLFERVLRLRPEEPQSPRDLALALDRRAGTRERTGGPLPADAATDYGRALSLLAGVVEGEWDARFSEVEVIALVEANRIQSLLERAGRARPWPLDARLRRLLDFDLRVVLTWDTDQTDMDLWVVEPTGERCLYSHPYTAIGGHLSKDFTGGYGPEEYSIRRAAGGDYAVKANFFGSQSLQLTGPTIVQATVITDYGRPSEQRRAITVRLASAREVVDIGQVAVAKRGKS